MSDHRTTYRYKLSPEIIDENNSIFKNTYVFIEREVFREKWNEWLVANNELIDKEKARLTEIGIYKNQLLQKCLFQQEYYFKNKEHKPEQDTSNEKDTSKPRAYIKNI